MSTGSPGQTIANTAFARAMSGAKPSTIAITHPPHSHRGKNLLKDRSKYGAKKVKKEKKMGWFRKKFNSWVRQAWEDARSEPVDTDVIRGHDSIGSKSSVRFTVYPASGGFVIESYKQDRYKENDGPTLTIVNHGDDLGKAVEHIIAIEALRT